MFFCVDNRQIFRFLIVLSGLAIIAMGLTNAVGAAGLTPATGGEPTDAKRPNVLIIYGDDQGSIDLGCFGATDLKTPSLDQLAKGGLRLTQMYAPAPVCSASRVGLLTGRFPVRAGQASNGPMRAEEVTIAEAFRKSGYATGHVGKWHLGEQHDQVPSAQGFDSWFGHLQGCIDNYSHFYFWSGPNRHDLWDNGSPTQLPGQYFPDLMADRCSRFMEQNREQPWLLYWAFNAPHYPYQGTPEWFKAYEHLPSPRREYAAFVSTMDAVIGTVLDRLEQLGLADNTIVIYQPDHGHSTEVRAFGGGGNSGPYRGAKFSLFEGGLRVPTIIRYPAHFPAGQSRNQFTTACDWFPTLADICGVELPEVVLDGVSLVDVLTNNAPAPRERFYWQLGTGEDFQWAVRDERWKLIANPVDTTLPEGERKDGGRLAAPFFLADLESDISERDNLADAHPDVVSRLKRLRDELLNR